MSQKQLRTDGIAPNDNISFPIGSVEVAKECYSKLELSKVFSPLKCQGWDINNLIKGQISYRLSDNHSVSRCGEWMNRPEVLEAFGLEKFDKRVLYRTLEVIGENRHEIMKGILEHLFATYHFEHTDINMDWTSIVLHGNKCKIGKYGYSRDHRPDKKQVTIGLSELRSPINVPVGLTVQPGNMNDITHFTYTFEQVKPFLKEGSLVVFDKGASSKENLTRVQWSKMKYISSKKWNRSDDKVAALFSKETWELLDPEVGLWGMKRVYPSRVDYFYFSERLKKDQLESASRRARRKLEEAKTIQSAVESNRGMPRRFTVNNPLVKCRYWFQTRLEEMSEDEAMEYLEKELRTGREGFFCLISSEDLTLQDALKIYREKDTIEKLIQSFKNEIDITPLRVRKEECVYGAVIIGFLAQLFISLLRIDVPEIKRTSTKFVKQSLMNLTVTVEKLRDGRRRKIYSNFDPINRAIIASFRPFT